MVRSFHEGSRELKEGKKAAGYSTAAVLGLYFFLTHGAFRGISGGGEALSTRLTKLSVSVHAGL